MKKDIIVNENHITIYINSGYATDTISIVKAYFKDGKIDKTITFTIWDDISFRAYDFDNNHMSRSNQIDFDISIDDKFYFALNRLLGDDDSLLIDDDDTKEKFVNYMKISRENNKILISIHNEELNKPNFERFSVFVKNVGPDVRSKIDDFNIKYRIYKFFMEAKEILLNECHQYTLDEYIEILKANNLFEGDNLFIKNERKFKNASESCLNCCNKYCTEDKSISNWCSNYNPKVLIKKETTSKLM